MISGAGGETQGNIFEALMALLLSDKLGEKSKEMPARDPKLDQVRDVLRENLMSTLGGNGVSKPDAPRRT